MIIGKSLTALGGGGLKPEIIVTAKAGALLNLHYKDSSIILQSYQLGAEETQHMFVVDVSETAYVVEDVTNGASVEVLVDVVAQYSVEIGYILWLYRDGDECKDVTGGWYFEKSGGNATPYMTKENSYFDIRTPVSSDGHLKTNNIVSLLGYTKINFEYSYNCGTTYSKFHSQLGTKDIIVSSSVVVSSPASITFDQKSAFNFAYVANFGSGYLRIHKIWLE